MMNKKLLFLTLALAIGFFSCQDNQEVLLEPDENGLVSLDLGSENNYFKKDGDNTKLLVNSAGYTIWANGDVVFVVDQTDGNEGYIGRPFTITGGGGTSEATFKGKLLAGRDRQKYYAYHAAEKSPCVLNGTTLTVTREEVSFFVEEETKAIEKGKYCSMIALPIEFNAQIPSDNKIFEFYHLNSLIEARVRPDSLGTLLPMVFDRVVFTVTAINPSEVEGPTNGSGSLPVNIGEYNEMMPFYNEVTVDLKNIRKEFSGNYDTVEMSIDGAGAKVGQMTTEVTYPAGTTFASRLTSGAELVYDIPIYALPTTDMFSYRADVIFYNEGIEVYHVYRTGWADGLKHAALNDIYFGYERRVP